jgi:hypothetical protein
MGDSERRISIAIVGAPKSATTSMLRYLGQHPELYDHPQAECDFFLNDDEFARGWSHAQERYYADDPGPPVQLVAKRALMLYDEASLRRLAAHNPAVVVAVMLRDPVDRAFSAYGYARLRGWQKPEPFEAAIEPELNDGPLEHPDPHGPEGYLSKGVYVWHVRRLLEVFPQEQVHVFTTEAVAAAGENGAVWRTLFGAVGVDPSFVPEYEIRHNVAATPRSERVAQLLASKTGVMGVVRRVAPDRVLDTARRVTSTVIDKPAPVEGMAPETRLRLEEFFRPFNRELEELLGRPLSWG